MTPTNTETTLKPKPPCVDYVHGWKRTTYANGKTRIYEHVENYAIWIVVGRDDSKVEVRNDNWLALHMESFDSAGMTEQEMLAVAFAMGRL